MGNFAIQLAKVHGAHPIATAAGRNADFVRSLGAEQVIDYKQARFEDFAHDMDVVFDTVGGETLNRSWQVLKPGGRLVTVASSGEGINDPRVKDAFFIVEPSQKQLYLVADLLDRGKLRVAVDAVAPFSRAREVFAGTFPRQNRGKLVIAVA